MFESYYKLDANLFRLSADEQFRFAHKNYLKAWSYLRYALEQGEGFIMVTGRPGSGKTTLIRDILSEVDQSKILAINLVTNQLQAEELLRKVALEFGLKAETYNKATLLTRIEDFVTKEYNAGRRAVIVIDEAQNLTLNGLEELRLLSNLQAGSHPLFQIFLIGQEQLRTLILSPGMEQISQRLIASCQIESMDVKQTEGYIEHRLGIVGWNHDPELCDEIFPLIHYLSQGVPRKINHIVSRLLLYGALEEKHGFTEEDVWIVARELFDEERLSIQSGDSFTTFRHKYEEGTEILAETHAPDLTSEGPEPPQDMDAESISTTKPDAPLVEEGEGEADLVSEAEAAAEAAAEAEAAAVAEAEATLASRPEAESPIEPDTDEALHESEFYPYGESLVDSDTLSLTEEPLFEASHATASSDATERLAEPLTPEQASTASRKTYLDETELDALTSKLEHEGVTIEETPTEINESKPEDILNLPSMQAERRKHEVDQKGGFINTAETVEVEELFSGTFGKSLRNILLFVIAGLFFLALFVIEPERIDQTMSVVGDKLQSMILPSRDESPKRSSASGSLQQKPEPEISQSTQDDEVASAGPPNEQTVKPSEEEKVEDNPDPVVTTLDGATSTDETDILERASKDYIATQSKYQKVEIVEKTEKTIAPTPIAREFQIYFEFDNPNIPDQFKEMLNDLYVVLSINKKTYMTITGFTDASGDPVYNLSLSEERAQAVSRYFIDKGISPERIQVEGRGPVPKSSEEERETLEKRFGNRRVEIILREISE